MKCGSMWYFTSKLIIIQFEWDIVLMWIFFRCYLILTHCLYNHLKGLFTQKWKLCYELLALMSFQTHKTVVHLRNTNEDVYIFFYVIQELFDPYRQQCIWMFPGT